MNWEKFSSIIKHYFEQHYMKCGPTCCMSYQQARNLLDQIVRENISEQGDSE